MSQNAWPLFLASFPPEDRYEPEERAAIHEFDGGLSRREAEARTISDQQNQPDEQGELL